MVASTGSRIRRWSRQVAGRLRCAGPCSRLPAMSGGDGLRCAIAEVTRGAALAGGVDERLLTGYPEILLDVGRTGRRLSREELDGRRHRGVLAAELNVPLGTLVDLYLGTTRTVWDGLPGARSGRAHEIAAAILCA